MGGEDIILCAEGTPAAVRSHAIFVWYNDNVATAMGSAMRDIAEWLASIGLGEYAQRFAENAIDLSVVRDLTEQDLKDLGVLLGHRRKMLRAIAEIKGAVLTTPQTGAKLEPRD